MLAKNVFAVGPQYHCLMGPLKGLKDSIEYSCKCLGMPGGIDQSRHLQWTQDLDFAEQYSTYLKTLWPSPGPLCAQHTHTTRTAQR